MKKAIFITVRSGSTRLPNKATKEILNSPTIEHLIKRVKRSKLADIVVLCTSVNNEDKKLCEIANRNGILCFQGSLKDKLVRWRDAAIHYNVEYFVNVDGDDLFCEPELIDLAFMQYEKEKHDFVKVDETEIVVGAFTLGATRKAIEKVCEIKDTDDTEAAWLYFSDLDIFKTNKLQNVPEIYNRPDIRATLDYEEDFVFFRNIIEHFSFLEKDNFCLRDVVEYVNDNPSVLLINSECQQKYLNNQKKLTKLILKEDISE